MPPHPPATVTWWENDQQRRLPWRDPGERRAVQVVVADDLTADAALRIATRGTGLLWRGDFRGARQLRDALRRRLARRGIRDDGDPRATYLRVRQAAAHRARVLGMVLIELDADDRVPLPHAPDVRRACREAFGPPVARSLIPLQAMLGAMGARQWRERGVAVPALGERIHPHHGVFAPTRSDYVDLVARAPLPDAGLAFDIGTGTGVLAAVLARRGVARVVATDVQPAAVVCARENLARLGLDDRVEVRRHDLFPRGRAGLVVVNPPWLPGTPHSPLEAGVFDPGGRLLARIVRQLPDHLTPGGEAWLVLSDLAELLGLRTRDALLAQFGRAGLVVRGRLDARPSPTPRPDDPLRHLRAQETVSLWRLGLAR
ncbi:methyltransferase [Pseudonocardia kunmingensis]|uniref:Methylase of polypeptide subunit release factors n=1 Tax=Pseudonocardia kunmingensis TaxID=630975 RepID=A0A543DJE1_9PSEU|nr:class I SAM-dependent methyltransferase [Pseudonocardia kunmingensis]TQM09439.1 methylase of polypeptide subunit release factors [Pseudonocardia kunmingensis]